MRLFLFLAIVFLVAEAGAFRAKKYTVHDDFSWAITREDHLADPYHQQLYDTFMEQCNDATRGGCQAGEDYRLRMNRDQPGGVYNYTTVSSFEDMGGTDASVIGVKHFGS